MNRENLAKLAAYLDNVPAEDFGMQSYKFTKGSRKHVKPFHPEPECGTVSCAVGHGPNAGIPVPEGVVYWWEYSAAVFIPDNTVESDWCFDAEWATADNTAQGAAKRIRYLLEHGLPENWYRQMTGYDPLCYL